MTLILPLHPPPSPSSSPLPPPLHPDPPLVLSLASYWVACTNTTNLEANDKAQIPISTTGPGTTGPGNTGPGTTGPGRRRLREKSLIDTLTQCNITFTVGGGGGDDGGALESEKV